MEYGMEDCLSFGKYQGEQVEDLIEDDPEYLKWVAENTMNEFTEEVMQELDKI